MTLTNAQRTNFFTAGVQMALTNNQRQALAWEGLANETDFEDFKVAEMKDAFKNARSGLPGIPGVPGVPEQVDADGNVIAAAVAPIPPVPGVQASPIPARCSSRLLVTLIAWNYYHDTNREITQNNIHFQNTLRNFQNGMGY